MSGTTLLPLLKQIYRWNEQANSASLSTSTCGCCAACRKSRMIVRSTAISSSVRLGTNSRTASPSITLRVCSSDAVVALSSLPSRYFNMEMSVSTLPHSAQSATYTPCRGDTRRKPIRSRFLMPACTALLLMCIFSASSASVGSFSPGSTWPERIMPWICRSNNSVIVGATMV